MSLFIYLFYIVELHRPEHVLQQFGLLQGIPSTSYVDYDLHFIDQRSRPWFD